MAGMQHVPWEFWEKVLKKCQRPDSEDVHDSKGLKYLKLESDLFKLLFYGRTWGRDRSTFSNFITLSKLPDLYNLLFPHLCKGGSKECKTS